MAEQLHLAVQRLGDSADAINETDFAQGLDELTQMLNRESSENGGEDERSDDRSNVARRPPADAIRHRRQKHCRHCIHYNNAHQVIHHLKAFRKMCKKTECPFLKKMCRWARKHHKEFLGVLTAHTTPHRFSAGFCSGKGYCDPHDLPCEARH